MKRKRRHRHTLASRAGLVGEPDSERFIDFSNYGIFIPDSALPKRTKVDTIRVYNLIWDAGQGCLGA